MKVLLQEQVKVKKVAAVFIKPSSLYGLGFINMKEYKLLKFNYINSFSKCYLGRKNPDAFTGFHEAQKLYYFDIYV